MSAFGIKKSFGVCVGGVSPKNNNKRANDKTKPIISHIPPREVHFARAWSGNIISAFLPDLLASAILKVCVCRGADPFRPNASLQPGFDDWLGGGWSGPPPSKKVGGSGGPLTSTLYGAKRRKRNLTLTWEYQSKQIFHIDDRPGGGRGWSDPPQSRHVRRPGHQSLRQPPV